MTEQALCLSEYDVRRLRDLLAGTQGDPKWDPQDLQALDRKLDQGRAVGSLDIPPDLVTMNSVVRLRDLATAEAASYRLVFPEDLNREPGCVCILAPMGVALLGCRVGETLTWTTPAGPRQLRVEAILYQPETVRQYHL